MTLHKVNAEWDDSQSGDSLNQADAAALEALIDAEFDLTRVPTDTRDRAARAAGLLGLLGTPVQTDLKDDGLLVDATLARVAAVRASVVRHAAQAERDFGLIGDDEDALELLVSAGFKSERVPGRMRIRAQRTAALLGLLDTPVESGSREALVQATLDRVQQTVDKQTSRMRLEERPTIARRLRLGDLISVAAMLLLAGAVLIPMAGAMREMSRRSACQTGMAQAGLGFGQYAGDYKDSLPLASASMPGSQWWNVGDKDRSNSANLFTLARAGYLKVHDLACPGNSKACRDTAAPNQFDWKYLDQVSFSYQNMFAKERPKLSGPVTITLIADRSPIIPLAIQRKTINPLQNSLQHDGRGQSVLESNGAVLWLRTPVLANGDNIFLPRPLEELIARLQHPNEAAPLKGTEEPEGADDVFLAP